MKGKYLKPRERIADFVEEILIIENYDVKNYFALPLYANGKPTLLFQTIKGNINDSLNYLTLFGQTIFPEKISFTGNFTLIAYFFKPFALTSLFGFSAQELTDSPINLNLLENKKTSELQEKLLNTENLTEKIELLDNYIFSLITKVQTDYVLIKCATTLIAESPKKEILSQVQNKFYITERTFQRKFINEVGISPNKYRRIAQFNAAFQQLNKKQFENLTDIAFDHNYADQSHFIRAFKEFTNLTPKEYLNLGKNVEK